MTAWRGMRNSYSGSQLLIEIVDADATPTDKIYYTLRRNKLPSYFSGGEINSEKSSSISSHYFL